MPPLSTGMRGTVMARSIGLAVVLLFATLYASPPLLGQTTLHDAINPAGSRWTSDNGDLSWTLGDLAAALYMTPTLHYREGFQNAPACVTVATALQVTWDVDVFPNPARSELRIAFGSQHEPCTLRLFDRSGREVAHVAVQSDLTEAELALDAVASGTYYLSLQGTDGPALGGFVVMIIR